MIFRRKKISLRTPVYNPATALTARPSKKILVVDDDPVILKTLSLKLKSRGFAVVTARDGSEALNVTRKARPDLMLMDVNFPPDVGGVNWNGFRIAQWLRKMDEASNMPLIVMTGSDQPEQKASAEAAGASAFFRKPINHEELFVSIDTALSGQPEKRFGAFEI